MRTRHIFAFILLLLSAVGLYGQNQFANRIYIHDVTAMGGTSVIMPVMMDNNVDVVAMQFDIVVPANMTLSNARICPDRATDHTVELNRRGYADGNKPVYRVMLYSPTNANIKGRTGQLLSLSLFVNSSAREGDTFPIDIQDGIMTTNDGTDVLDEMSAGNIVIAPYADIIVPEVSFSPSSALPGDNLTVNWSVKNIGGSATADGWREEVQLVTREGSLRYLGELRHDGTLDAGATISRQATFMLSKSLGVDGDVQVRVRLIPYSNCGESPSAQNNNTTLSENKLSINKRLFIDLGRGEITEGSITSSFFNATLTRSGNWDIPETFTVSTSGDSRISVGNNRAESGTQSTQVTIGAGASATNFRVFVDDNNTLDATDAEASFSASGAGYANAEASLTVIDNDLPRLTLTPSKSSLHEGENFTLTIEAERAPSTDLTLSLNCDAYGRFRFPVKAVLPAGQTSMQVDVEVVDDDIPALTAQPTFNVRANGYENGECFLILEDNDIPVIDLTLTPTTISESAGPKAVVARLTRTGSTDNKITIKLSDSTGDIYFPTPTITLNKGVTEAEFALGVNDNQLVDGDRDAVVTAAVYISSCSCSATGESAGMVSKTLRIIDNDGPSITIASSKAMLLEGTQKATVLTITRNTAPSTDLAVHIVSDYDEQLTYQHDVVIPQGSTSITVDVDSKPNAVNNDDHTIVFRASAPSHNDGTCWAMVSDQTLPDAVVSGIVLNKTEEEVDGNIAASITIVNEGSFKMPAQTQVMLYMVAEGRSSGSPYKTIYTDKAIEPGASISIDACFDLPSTVGRFDIFAVVNEAQKVRELTYLNNSSERVAIDIKPSFTAIAQVDKNIYVPGETVMISGKAIGSKAAGSKVEIYTINSGLRDTITTTTDSEGNFSISYIPIEGMSGHFDVGACYPSENATVAQTSFDIYGMRRTTQGFLTNEIYVDESYKKSFEIVNTGNLPLSGIKAEVEGSHDGVTIDFNCPKTLAGGATMTVEYTLKGKQKSEGTNWKNLKVVITSAEGARTETTLYYYVRNQKPQLVASIDEIRTTVTKGTMRDYKFLISNTGKGATGNISILLPSVMQSVTPSTLPSLNQGDTATVILRMVSDNMELNLPVTGRIAINCEKGDGIAMPYSLEAVSEVKGTLVIDVCDEYTYNTNERPHVAGAKVTIQHPTTGNILAQGLTADDGTFSVNINEGYYTVIVTADKHESWRSDVMVDPGVTTTKIVNISISTVTVDWNVVETEVKDEYEIVTTVKYETNVPAPVVEVIQPDTLFTDNLAVGESLVYYTTLTNHGLISAQQSQLELPKGLNNFRFEPLINAEPMDIPAKSSVTIPVKVTRIAPNVATQVKAFGANKLTRSSGSTDDCSANAIILYAWDCGTDKKWHKITSNSMRLSPASSGPCDKELGSSSGGGGSVMTGPTGVGGGSGGRDIRMTENTYTTKQIYDGCEPYEKVRRDCFVSFIPYVGQLNDWWREYTDLRDDLDKQGEASDATMRSIMYECGTQYGNFLNYMSEVTNIDDFSELGDNVGVLSNAISCLDGFVNGSYLSDGYFLGDDLKTNVKPILKAASPSVPSYYKVWQEAAKVIHDESLALHRFFVDFYGDTDWMDKTTFQEQTIFLKAVKDAPADDNLKFEDLVNFKPTSLTDEQLQSFIDRRVNTYKKYSGMTVEGDNYQNYENTDKHVSRIISMEKVSSETWGYETTAKMWIAETNKMIERNNETSSSVCASITLQFKQTMTMTRQAFRGTLTVYNGNETGAMENVRLNLELRNTNTGELAGSRQFQMNAESLTGFIGETSLESAWSLAGHETGVAEILFIPSKYAAPTEPQNYSFGGTLTYIDPFSGLEVTRHLTPITLTVKPSPQLNMTYFMQRDIIGDDPLTKEIEPCEEAEFALLINNVGYGDATNVQMTTAQPQITENEKGLLVDFQITGSQLNGADKSLSLGENVATDFGTIKSKSTTYAQWWLEGSLLGHFTDYNVEATHLTSYGNEDLSLLNEITIHELIRSLDVPGTSLKAWLVNDILDADDTPDNVYLSDATTAPVSVGAMTISKIDATTYALTLTPGANGWNYASVADPTYGQQTLVSITRQGDNATIPLRNCWQTDRTLRDGRDPLYENRIHICDNVTATETYILEFTERPSVILSVESFQGAPAEHTVADKAVASIDVTFNKAVEASTFTTDDIALSLQGVRQDVSLITISTMDNVTFTLNLAQLNEAIAEAGSPNGYYVLTVQTAGITGADGFEGKRGTSVAWNVFDPTATGIANVEDKTKTVRLYDLSGRLINVIQKRGLYITRQGKRVVK